MVLDAQPDLEVVAEATEGDEAVDLALSEDVHLAILDISMPRMTGLQAAREITRRAPNVRVLMLSMHDNEQYLFEAIRVGAAGYVLKSAVDRDLVEACRAAMRGEPFLYPGAVRALMREYSNAPRRRQAPRPDAHSSRGGDPQARRRSTHQRRDRGDARHQQKDRRPPSREHLEKLGMPDRVELTRYVIRRGPVQAERAQPHLARRHVRPGTLSPRVMLAPTLSANASRRPPG